MVETAHREISPKIRRQAAGPIAPAEPLISLLPQRHDSGIGKMVKLNMVTSHSPFNIFLISGSKLMNAGDQLS